ncbi:MAG: hypothetical protein CM15mV79_260 [uncultured marine virus]|nr:MAG: hypothetical protein CM15mV79_260 [uncultured marine virus]
MTYLNLVNNVLRRLREDTVSTVSNDTYSTMVGDFVNDAKEMVESAWDWSALRTTSGSPLTITTSSGDFTYSLTGSGDKGKVLNLINDTSNLMMEYQTQNWFDDKFLIQNPASGAPEYYTYNGVDTNGDAQIDVYPKPDGVYSLKSRIVIRKTTLTNDTDTLAIPSTPVIHLAVALLARERGETGGTSTAEYFAIADKYLSDAVALDAQKHPEETIFYTP